MAESKLNILVSVRDQASGALSRLSNELGDFGNNVNFAADKAGILAGAMGAIASVAIADTVGAFNDAQAKMASFDALMKTLPPHLQALRGEILKVADNALLKFGFDNEEAALSMAKLLNITRSGPLTFQAFQAAMDLARMKNMSLEESTNAIIKAFNGQGRALQDLGIPIDEHMSKETILANIMAVAAGQAEAYANTNKGQLEILGQLTGELKENIGATLTSIPVIQWVTDKVKAWVIANGGLDASFQKLKPLLQVISAILVGMLVVGIGAAIAAAIVFIGFIGTTTAVIVAAAAAIAALGVMVAFHWEAIKNKTLEVWGAIKETVAGVITSIVDMFDKAVAKITAAIEAIKNAYTKVRETVSGAVSTTVNTVKKAVPKFAEGGIVTGPMLGLVGEAGPEAIIPLSQLGNMGGGGVTINLQGDFYTDSEVAEKFGNQLAFIIKNQLNLSGIRA